MGRTVRIPRCTRSPSARDALRRSDEQGAGPRREDVGPRRLVRLRVGGNAADGLADGPRAVRRLVARGAHAHRDLEHRGDRDPARRDAAASPSTAEPEAKPEPTAPPPHAPCRTSRAPPPPAPAQAAKVLTQEPKPDEPVDLTGNTIIQGNADTLRRWLHDGERNEHQRRANAAEPHRRPRRDGHAAGPSAGADEGPVAGGLPRRKLGLELPLPGGGRHGADGRGVRHSRRSTSGPTARPARCAS